MHRLATSHGPVFFSKQSLLAGSATPCTSYRRPTRSGPLLRSCRYFAEFATFARSPWYSLPDHLRRGVHAMVLARDFSRQRGSSTSPRSARHQVSAAGAADFAYDSPYTAPRTTSAWAGPSCVIPHRLLLLQRVADFDSPASLTAASTSLGMGEPKRVREYQPVVHRRRLGL